MSTTSSLYAEVWRNNQWEPIPLPKWSNGKQIPICYISPGTPYELYAALVGYDRRDLYHLGHTEEIIPLSKPRGFPKDVNAVYKAYFDDTWTSLNRYLTWFMVQEIIDYDWDKKFPPCIGYVENQHAYLFDSSACFPDSLPDDASIYMMKREGRTEVSWVESYRDFVGPTVPMPSTQLQGACILGRKLS